MSLVSSNKTETNTYELQIAIGSEEFEKAVETAYRRNKNKVNVPGFRKGKAPRSFIEKMYGESFFYEEAVNSLYPAAYSSAIDEAGIEPVDRADIEITEVSR